MSIKNIYINSNPSFIDLGGTDGNFTITKPYSNFNKAPTKVKLLSARIPFTWDNITSINNTCILIVGTTNTTIQIATGRYTGLTLATAFQNALNAVNSSNTYTVSYNTTTFQFTISSNVAFQLNFNVANSIGYALGFGNIITASGTHITSPEIAILQSDTEILVISNLVSGIDNGVVPWFTETSGDLYPNYNILGVIPINTCYGGIIYYQSSPEDPWFECSQSTFSMESLNGSSVVMQFGLLLLSGETINLNGAHWSANILLSFN